MTTTMNRALATRVLHTVRMVPDYPTPGIRFQDITPVLADHALLTSIIEDMAAPFRDKGVTHVVGIEARGFILGAPVALLLGAGFVPVRKAGKLPWKSHRREYELEYGKNVVEAHADAFGDGGRALIVDDVLATGGTAQAAAALTQDLGATLLGWSFLLEIGGLGGRARLDGAPVHVTASVVG